GRQARGIVAFAGQRFQREGAALALGADADRHGRRAGGVLLGERIPLAAGFAFTLPAIIGRAAILADKGKRVLGHELVPRSARAFSDLDGIRIEFWLFCCDTFLCATGARSRENAFKNKNRTFLSG